MKQVPYHGNPGNACALACYTMAAQYLLPEKHFTFEQLAKITDWKKGYVVWGFKLWKYLMDQGIHVTDYDTFDYDGWVKEGVKGLKRTTPPKEFKFYLENTYDLEAESKLAKPMLEHPNFTYIRRKPTWDDVVSEFKKSGICDVTLNGRLLHDRRGFTVHRVIVIDISDKEVVIHDPNSDWSGKYRHVPLPRFRDIFEAMEEPELCRYFLS